MANTHKGRKIYIGVTAPGGVIPEAQAADMLQAAFEAQDWTLIGHAGLIGDVGTSSNPVAYDELDTDVSQRSKGITNAGDPQIEVAYTWDDPGQIAMRAAADTKFNYPFKIVNTDAPSASFNPSVTYHRGMVMSKAQPGGRVEDFNLEIYQLALNQKQINVDPVALAVPVVVFIPSIFGVDIKTGTLLTADNGLWTNSPVSYTYNWQHDTAGNGTFVNASPVGIGQTYTPLVGNVGNAWRVQVTANNAAGASTTANSLRTGLQVA